MSGREMNDAEAASMLWNDRIDGVMNRSQNFDSSLAETIDRLTALDDAPAADPGFAQRLEGQLLNGFSRQRATTNGRVVGGGTPPAVRMAEPLRPVATQSPGKSNLSLLHASRRKWSMMIAAAVLAILATAAIVIYLVEPNDEAPRSIPAVAPEQTAAVQSRDGALVENVFSAIVDPLALAADRQDEWQRFQLEAKQLAPGERYSKTLPRSDAGLKLFYIAAGTGTVQVEGPSQVVRANGVAVNAPAATILGLHEGDTVAFGASHPYIIQNSNQGEMELVVAGLCALPCASSNEIGSGGWYGAGSMFAPGSSVNSGPLSISIDRATIGTDGSIAYDVADGDMLGILLSGENVWKVAERSTGELETVDHLIKNSVHVLHRSVPGRYLLQNREPETATVYVVRVRPATD